MYFPTARQGAAHREDVMATPKFRTIHDLAEAELSKACGSLVRVPSGTVFMSNGAIPWDMQREWRGRELEQYTARHSTWGDTTRIALHVALSSELQSIPMFYVSVDGRLTEEETKQMAEVYMMALNLRRVI
jgi:hypothetical protein